MEGILKMIDKFFGWIIGILGSLMSMFVFYQYTDFQNFKKEITEKFVLKSDCQREFNRLHMENREDHRLIFQRLDKIVDQQTLILQGLEKKADRT